MSLEPSVAPVQRAAQRERELLAPGPLTAVERAAVERAIVRCHIVARLPPPATIAWFGAVEAARRYADAAVGGDLTGAPAPVTLTPSGPLARARRVVAVPWAAMLGCGFGIPFGLAATMFVLGLPYWLFGFGPPLALFVAIALVLRRMQGIRGWVLSALWLAAAAGFSACLFAMIGWLARFPEGTFLLPTAILSWLLPAALGLACLGGVLLAVRTARSRLQTAGARPEVVAMFATQLGSVLPAAPARSGTSGVPDVLDRVAPGWRPFPVRAAVQDGPPGRGPWRWLRRARLRRRLAAVRPAGRVLGRAFPGLVVAVQPPRELHVGPAGLDRWDGPALVWADGTPEYFLRGVRVPRSPALGHWSVEEIHEVANSEVRRIMIEAIGWDEYLRAAQLQLLSGVPDPGNPPHRLELYDLPEGVFGPVHLLVMVNGSPDRTGSWRRYAEFVPDGFSDPVAAAAWQYGVGVAVYRELQRRT